MSAIISTGITSSAVYLYPSYATFKTLSHRPGTEQDVDKWLTYWCVVGAFVAFESLFEWLVRWVPFYNEIKTLFLLFLSQGGSGFIYKEYLAPRYALYEPQIDVHLAAIKTRTTEYIQENIKTLYEFVLRTISGVVASAGAGGPREAHSEAGDVSGAAGGRGVVEAASDVWNTYGAALLAAGARHLGASNAPSPHDPKRSASPSPSAHDSPSARSSAHLDGYALGGQQ